MPPSCRAPWLCTPGRGTKWTSPARCLPTPVPQSHGSEMVSCCQAPTTAISRSTTAPLPATWRWAGHGSAAGWKGSLTIDGLLDAAKILLASRHVLSWEPLAGAELELQPSPCVSWATPEPGRQSAFFHGPFSVLLSGLRLGWSQWFLFYNLYSLLI